MKISNSKIHWFNPGHEDAIRTGSPYYTPPASVCRMMNDLAMLPLWYGNENDYVIVSNANEASRFLLSLPETIRPEVVPIMPPGFHISDPAEAAPWGLSPQSIRFYETLPELSENITVPLWHEKYKELTGRQTALMCLSKIQSLLPDNFNVHPIPHVCTSVEKIHQFISEYPPPYILKTPYSCAGRGLYHLLTRDLDTPASRWIAGALKKQGAVSIECFLDKVCDFAMEFESDGKGNIGFKGLAVFNTLTKGIYYGNLLGSQRVIEKHLAAFIQIDHLHMIQKTISPILSETLGYDYSGYFGVDMMVYRKDNMITIHPLVEINLRYTMGLVALQLSNRLIYKYSRGQLVVTYNKDKNKICNFHHQLKENYPLILSGSKIQSGYLSLCPVLPDTQYLAYILVEHLY